jgi:arylsulfatase A-like enzyme
MKRREFVRSIGWGAVVFASERNAPPRAAFPPISRPNILFIMADDHASQAISCYGSRVNATPQIDRLAKEGIRFDNCFCTNGICAPSRAVILTGKHSHLNGVRDNAQVFDGAQATLPKLLRQGGYRTALVGKWHLKSDPTGFDDWNILIDQGEYYNPDFIEMGVKKRYPGYVTDIITGLSLDFMEKTRTGHEPFFLMMHHKAPHRNWPSTTMSSFPNRRRFSTIMRPAPAPPANSR